MAESLSISTILGHLVQDRHCALGNSRFGFVSARREAEVKLGLRLRIDLEVELRSVQCFPTRKQCQHANHGGRSAGRLRKRRVATQLSAAGGSIVIEVFDGQ
jgi:hypothetical protein